ncbi:MAG TPA: STAS domain-containing protein [Roseiflexaceae bacterium]|nr:STAS domain-containing protein [Roseiflexaceae bacterium]
MSGIFQRLTRINSTDPDKQRRGRVTIIACLGLIVLVLLWFFPSLFMLSGTAATTNIAVSIAALVVYTALLALARSGRVDLSSFLLICAITCLTIPTITASDQSFYMVFFLVLPIVFASLVLRPKMIWAILAITVVATLVAANLMPERPLLGPLVRVLYMAILLQGIVALLSFLNAAEASKALLNAMKSQLSAEQAASQLERANADLEAHVALRTRELQAVLTEVESRANEQERLLTENEQQRMIIRELSVPVLPINDSTLIMPLIGALDTARLRDIQQQALEGIERYSARRLLLDITGVPVVDSQVAQGLMAVVQAAWLLGAEIMLVGIRPEVAQAIVGLGLSLDRVRTFSDLRAALAVANKLSNKGIATQDLRTLNVAETPADLFSSFNNPPADQANGKVNGNGKHRL